MSTDFLLFLYLFFQDSLAKWNLLFSTHLFFFHASSMSVSSFEIIRTAHTASFSFTVLSIMPVAETPWMSDYSLTLMAFRMRPSLILLLGSGSLPWWFSVHGAYSRKASRRSREDKHLSRQTDCRRAGYRHSRRVRLRCWRWSADSALLRRVQCARYWMALAPTFQPKPAESAPAPSDTAGREPQSQYNPVPVLFPPFWKNFLKIIVYPIRIW